jgi:hypothetical protein
MTFGSVMFGSQYLADDLKKEPDAEPMAEAVTS